MGVKRIVDVTFWTDGKVDEFSPEDKYFMLYLLTNPFTTQLGIYEISIKQVAFQLGYSIDAVRALLDRFESKYDLIIWSRETNEIAIKNFLRHSVMKGGKPVADCIRKNIKSVKNKELINRVFGKVINYENLNVTVKEVIEEYYKENDIHNDNDNDNENERTGNVSSTIREIIDYLNQKAGTRYLPSTRKTQDCIKARLKETFTLDDFKTVIDKKCAEWLGDEKMEKFLRPETLFGTKFEGYLNQKSTARRTEQVPAYIKPRFNNFENRDGCNYDDLEKRLLQKSMGKDDDP